MSRARLFGSIVPSALAVWLALAACSSFDAEDDGLTADAGAGGGDTSPAVDAPVEGAAPFECTPLLPTLEESFSNGLGIFLDTSVGDGGTLGVDGGVLVASCTKSGTKSEGRRQFGGLEAPVGKARLSWTFKGLTAAPTNTFLEVGCGFEVRASDGGASTMRFELKDGVLRLDDTISGGGGFADSGIGPAVLSVTGSPQDVHVEVILEFEPGGGAFTTRAVVNGDGGFEKTTLVNGAAGTPTLRCGLLFYSGGGATVPYELALDDVRLDLCR